MSVSTVGLGAARVEVDKREILALLMRKGFCRATTPAIRFSCSSAPRQTVARMNVSHPAILSCGLHAARSRVFPFDMLRYDCCWPEEESDSPNVGMMYDNIQFI
jgi:hypothetical protein